MRKISEKQLTDNVNLVKWEQKKTIHKLNLLTVHSLLINNNPKFVQLKQKIEIFNANIQKGIERKHLQFEFIQKLYEMLRHMVQIPTLEGQQEFLNAVYDWSKQGASDNMQWDRYSQSSKSRPTTAATRTRPFSAYSRPKSGVSKIVPPKYEEKPKIREQNKIKKNIDYENLQAGDIEFYTGARTIHQSYENPKKTLKEYQRKIFYEDETGQDIEIIELKQKQEGFNLKTLPINLQNQRANTIQKQLTDGQNENKLQGQNQAEDQEQVAEGEEEINIDDLPIDGQPQEQQPGQIIDKLKPKIKAYLKHETDLSKNHLGYAEGIHHYIEERNKIIRKKLEDQLLKDKMLEWAKEKSKTKRQQKRRAESARIMTKQIGISWKQTKPQEENLNVINFQNQPISQTNEPRPKTAFRAFNQSNRKGLIQNCFITSRMASHIQKFDALTGTIEGRQMKITSLAQRPKKKNFQEILKEAEQKVKDEEINEIFMVKEKFAKNKVPFEVNRIAKCVTYHAMGAEQEQYEEDFFTGEITGMNMMKNPFFKLGKKKKKKKKKK